MAEAKGKTQTWRPNLPQTKDAPGGKYGGHDAAARKDAETPEQPNPSDPANTGTTPGSVADVG